LTSDFVRAFEALTGHPPLPWQQSLYQDFAAGRFPDVVELPTGLGKTMVIVCWLVALAEAPDRVPRRLIYIVNRRTVVDQSTSVVERIRDHLDYAGLTDRLAALCALPHDKPLAISTLRGQFADNREWRRDPARPAVVIGTVDMIGSRLLFSGYGAGYRSRPLLAGFLGQDSLIVHDEAHLEPAFQHLIESIEREQRRSRDAKPVRVVALSATPRLSGGQVFTLTDADRAHEVVKERLHAVKELHLHRTDAKKPDSVLVQLALQHRDAGARVVVFANTVSAVTEISRQLESTGVSGNRITQLTGTMRGRERDLQLALGHPEGDPVFAEFMSPRRSISGTVYLVSTSAGEVGVDISADHMVSDITTFESMTQRLGRVNRYGKRRARVDVVIPATELEGADGERHVRTVELLESLSGDASPAAIGRLPAADRAAAYAEPPAILPATDMLFDAWSLTTLTGRLPGRPDVAEYLHGVSPRQDGPRTYVAWRREVEVLRGAVLARHDPEELLDDYPLKPHEYLSDRTDRVRAELEQLAKRAPELPVWIVEPHGDVLTMTLGDIAGLPFRALIGRFVLLPPSAGGLRNGFLDSGAPAAGDGSEDVADQYFDRSGQRRVRLFDVEESPPGMRLERRILLQSNDEDDDSPRAWLWYVRADAAEDPSSSFATAKQTLEAHTEATARAATAIAAQILDARTAEAVRLAALAHDQGKRRDLWQRGIGNHNPSEILAKSDSGAATLRHGYRHELGSLAEINADRQFPDDDDAPVRELVLHLVAAHHGRARPGFQPSEQFDPERTAETIRAICSTVPERFGRLQQEYGRWGLAYLESILRAADYIASEDV